MHALTDAIQTRGNCLDGAVRSAAAGQIQAWRLCRFPAAQCLLANVQRNTALQVATAIAELFNNRAVAATPGQMHGKCISVVFAKAGFTGDNSGVELMACAPAIVFKQYSMRADRLSVLLALKSPASMQVQTLAMAMWKYDSCCSQPFQLKGRVASILQSGVDTKYAALTVQSESEYNL